MRMLHRSMVVIAGTTLGMMVSLGCVRDTPSLAGVWDATVTVDELEIPFRFEIVQDGSDVTGVFFNGDQRIESTAGELAEGTLYLSYDYYGTRLNVSQVDGRLEGQYERSRGANYPFRAQLARPASGVSSEVPSIAGVWRTGEVESSKGEAAWRLIVRQSGPDVSAAILRVDGDTGALTGRYADGIFVLSHFSGQRPTLLELTPAVDGTLAILRNKRIEMTAVREDIARERGLPEPTDPSLHSTVKNPDERFRFAFPDADGHVLADTDERFRDKVVVVSITGTWCPNCHDEAPFLTELYQQYRGIGLEIVALSFEEEAQLLNPTRLRAYVERYRIEYPMLLAGMPEEVNEKVPQIENLNSFPTTIYLGRDGRVRDVHAGFPSPASGSFYTETKDDIRAIIERLLAETPS